MGLIAVFSLLDPLDGFTPAKTQEDAEVSVIDDEVTESVFVNTPTAELSVTETFVDEPIQPTETVEIDNYAGLSVSAGDCSYGGKILSISALDRYTVEFELCKSEPAFREIAAFPVFSIQPAEYIEQTGGAGVILRNPIGTGPFKLSQWIAGEKIVIDRFPDYWDTPAMVDSVAIQWNEFLITNMQEFLSNKVDIVTNISDFSSNLESQYNADLIYVSDGNVGYLGISNTFVPYDDQRVRQALALAIDRQGIVDLYYPLGSVVASHFTPCEISGGCAGEDWYDYDPAQARELLSSAGYPNGFSTTIYYRDVYRSYFPDPGQIASEVSRQLKTNLNIDAKIVVMD